MSSSTVIHTRDGSPRNSEIPETCRNDDRSLPCLVLVGAQPELFVRGRANIENEQ